MPVITAAEAYLADLAVETVRTDALQTFVKQETVFVEIRTDDGGEGTGYSYTIGTGGTAVLAILKDHLLPSLPGRDPRRVEAIWRELFLSTKATTVGAITSLALAAVPPASPSGCSPAVPRTASRSTTPRAAGCTCRPTSWSPAPRPAGRTDGRASR
jgi:L-alanine-DL-glutamate epimerase-like enolase superfamily enzyme